MRVVRRMSLVAVVVLSWAPFLHAQSPVDPAGHWEGAVQVPEQELKFEIDLVRNAKGELAGTFTSAAQHLTGLPLSKVALDGNSITLIVVRPDQPFTGVMAADGTSITGTLTAEGHAIPFTMRRTGDARIEPPTKSAAVSKELEGTWNGTLDVNGTSMRIVLKLTNQADGTSLGTLANLDQGGAEIPISTITQKSSDVALDVKAVAGAYAGALNQDATELTGTWTQGPLSLPLTFRRAAAPDPKK